MHTVKFLAQLVEYHVVWIYTLIFLGLVVEGEFILLCTGILLSLRALELPPTLIVVFGGAFTKTFLGYYLGRCIDRKWANTKFLKYIEKHVKKIMPHFERRLFWSIFISKFLMVNHIVIIFAGYKKINFRKYFKAEFISTLIWAPGLLTIGYFFSLTALYISHEITEFTLIVLVLIALFLILDRVVSWAYQFLEEMYESV